MNFQIKYSNLKAAHNEDATHFTGNLWNAEKKRELGNKAANSINTVELTVNEAYFQVKLALLE